MKTTISSDKNFGIKIICDYLQDSDYIDFETDEFDKYKY